MQKIELTEETIYYCVVHPPVEAKEKHESIIIPDINFQFYTSDKSKAEYISSKVPGTIIKKIKFSDVPEKTKLEIKSKVDLHNDSLDK